jgi:hypothetical protein
MKNMKNYTDLEQSKKLTDILSIESADMEYMFLKKDGSKVSNVPFVKDGFEEPECCYTFIPCWSLAALLDILAKIASKIDDDGSANLSSFMGQWSVNMFDCPIRVTDNYDNPIDACYEMIIKLHERKML